MRSKKLQVGAMSLVVSISVISASYAADTTQNQPTQQLAQSGEGGVLGIGERFERTIRLGPNMVGELNIEDLGIGDQVTLHLQNPTNGPLTFRTTQPLGADKNWVVPAGSTRTINFTYTRPFSDSVDFVVIDNAGATVAQGVLMNVDQPLIGEAELGEDVFRRTITIQPGMGRIVVDDLDLGDTMVLTLVNPTNQELTFETTDRLGDEMVWTIPARSQRTVVYEHNQPFSDDVNYRVYQPSGTVISEGVLIEGTRQPTVTQPTERRSAVRGYW